MPLSGTREVTLHEVGDVPMVDGIRAEAAAIRVQRLGKRYEMYEKPHHRLLQTIFRGRKQYFRAFWALREVSFQIARGETVGIIGRNGSGKSTLLQLITGTLTPTEGSIAVKGRVAALLELGSGFNPEFTGRENVFLNGAILGMTRREMQKALPDIEAFASIGDFIDQPVKLYSSGMLIRLAFAVAVHVTPDVLLVDETLAVGDVAFQSKCLDRIRRMQEAGTAILLVSHSANTIIEFCSRAIYLDRGRVVLAGPSRDVLEQYGNDLVSMEGGTAITSKADGERSPSAALLNDRVTRTAGNLQSTEILSVEVLDAAGAPTACVAHGDEIAIVVTAYFHQPNLSPCLGLEIKTTDDIVLWSATTHYLGLHPTGTGSQQQRRYTWRIRANFGGSRFVLAIGIGEINGGEYRRHSRLHYAGHFDVLSEARRGNGFLEPNITFAEGEAVAVGPVSNA